MLDVGEVTQVRADLRQDLHHRRNAQPIDAREVHTGPVGEGLSNIERAALFAALLGRLAQVNVLTPQVRKQRLRLGVALADTLTCITIR